MLKNSLCFDERIKQIYTNVALEWEIQQGLTSKIINISEKLHKKCDNIFYLSID